MPVFEIPSVEELTARLAAAVCIKGITLFEQKKSDFTQRAADGEIFFLHGHRDYNADPTLSCQDFFIMRPEYLDVLIAREEQNIERNNLACLHLYKVFRNVNNVCHVCKYTELKAAIVSETSVAVALADKYIRPNGAKVEIVNTVLGPAETVLEGHYSFRFHTPSERDALCQKFLKAVDGRSEMFQTQHSHPPQLFDLSMKSRADGSGVMEVSKINL